MKTWADFLSNLFWNDERGDWWSLGDEHLNHMLMVMLLKEEPKFLESYLGTGERNVTKANFGSGKLRNYIGVSVSELDIHVEVREVTTLIEIKTWSSLKKHQRPKAFFELFEKTDRYRLLYVLLTDEATKSYPGELEGAFPQSEQVSVITRLDLAKELEKISASETMGQIATDYAKALRDLPSKSGWTE